MPAVLQFAGSEDAADLGPQWTGLTGRWRLSSGEALQESDDSVPAQAHYVIGASSFVCEVSLRARSAHTTTYGIAIGGINGPAVRWAILPEMRRVRVESQTGETLFDELLPPEFDPLAYHLLRIEVNGSSISTRLDGWLAQWDGELNCEPHALVLSATGQAAFSGFALTRGWEDSLMQEGTRLDRIGWESNGAGTWTLVAGSLRQDDPNVQEAWIMKPVLYIYILRGRHQLSSIRDVPRWKHRFFYRGNSCETGAIRHSPADRRRLDPVAKPRWPATHTATCPLRSHDVRAIPDGTRR